MKVTFTPTKGVVKLNLEPETLGELSELEHCVALAGMHLDEWLDTGVQADLTFDVGFTIPDHEDLI